MPKLRNPILTILALGLLSPASASGGQPEGMALWHETTLPSGRAVCVGLFMTLGDAISKRGLVFPAFRMAPLAEKIPDEAEFRWNFEVAKTGTEGFARVKLGWIVDSNEQEEVIVGTIPSPGEFPTQKTRLQIEWFPEFRDRLVGFGIEDAIVSDVENLLKTHALQIIAQETYRFMLIHAITDKMIGREID